MNVLNRERIAELTRHRSPLSVSMFMPTHRTGREQRQDTIRLKNLIGRAREKMNTVAESAADVDRTLQPLTDLRLDEIFWRYRSDGLACFCAPDFFRSYRVPIRLGEHLIVNRHFHLRPLLPLLRSDARIYILALTQETANLYEASRDAIREIELPGVNRPEIDGDQQPLQCHSFSAPAHGKGATDEVVYHGHGGSADRTKKDALNFFHSVDSAVSRVLQGHHSPLVLACVGYLAPLYESANRYKHLIAGKVPGSPDRWSLDELRQHAWRLAEPHFRRTQQRAWEELQQARTAGRASDKLRSVVLAADQGRVSRLFLARGQQCWGHVDPKLQAVHSVDGQAEGEDLLDYAAARTIGNGGEVFVFDSLPDTDSPVAASFRY